MAINYEMLRKLAQRAELQAPLKIEPALPFLDIQPDAIGGGSISISIPKNDGDEFSHWRYLNELGFIRVRNDGRPGIGVANNRVEGLTVKGEEFVELSRNDVLWDAIIVRCKKANACTIENILRELRKEARSKLSSKKKKKGSSL